MGLGPQFEIRLDFGTQGCAGLTLFEEGGQLRPKLRDQKGARVGLGLAQRPKGSETEEGYGGQGLGLGLFFGAAQGLGFG